MCLIIDKLRITAEETLEGQIIELIKICFNLIVMKAGLQVRMTSMEIIFHHQMIVCIKQVWNLYH